MRYAARDFNDYCEQYMKVRNESWRPQPQWNWYDARTGNGRNTDFALCRVWAGNYYGRIKWAVFSTNMTPPSLGDSIERLNKMLDNPKMYGKVQQSFSNIEEAQMAIEELFNQFQPTNKRILQGDLCLSCQKIYVPVQGDEPVECGRCVADKAIQDTVQEDDNDLVF